MATEPTIAARFFDADLEARNLEGDLDEAVLAAVGVSWDSTEEINASPFKNITYDEYDASFELKSVDPSFVITAEQWEKCRALGFSKAWVCYTDGTERYYPGGRLGPSHSRLSDTKSEFERGRASILRQVAKLPSPLSLTTGFVGGKLNDVGVEACSWCGATLETADKTVPHIYALVHRGDCLWALAASAAAGAQEGE